VCIAGEREFYENCWGVLGSFGDFRVLGIFEFFEFFEFFHYRNNTTKFSVIMGDIRTIVNEK
jgi:hypothetical protein